MSAWSPPVPERGDVVLAWTEASTKRSAFVLSPAAYCERTGFVLMCDVTAESTGYPFEVVAPDGHGGRHVILADRVRCLHARSWGLMRVHTLDDEVVREVLAKLGALVGPAPE